MTIRLVGEDTGVVQGLQDGWVREVSVSDGAAALAVDQVGAGPIQRWLRGGTVEVEIGNDGDIAIGTNKLKTTNLSLKESDGSTLGVYNAAGTAYAALIADRLSFNTRLNGGQNGARLSAGDADGWTLLLEARDSGVGLAEVAALVGAADPYFRATLPMVLNPSTAPAAPLEGHFYYDSTAKKLKFYNGTAWETVTSA